MSYVRVPVCLCVDRYNGGFVNPKCRIHGKHKRREAESREGEKK